MVNRWLGNTSNEKNRGSMWKSINKIFFRSSMMFFQNVCILRQSQKLWVCLPTIPHFLQRLLLGLILETKVTNRVLKNQELEFRCYYVNVHSLTGDLKFAVNTSQCKLSSQWCSAVATAPTLVLFGFLHPFDCNSLSRSNYSYSSVRPHNWITVLVPV